MSDGSALLELRNVSCVRAEAKVCEASLVFERGSINLLLGDGGAALLLRLASLLETPDSGSVLLDGVTTGDVADTEALRGRHFGFIYSSPYLLPGLSVAENVAMPLFRVLGIDMETAGRKTEAALQFVGLADLIEEDVGALSRFDQHRLALARSLAHDPRLLVLDRAEVNLSIEEAAEFRQCVERVRAERGITVLATVAAEPQHYRADRIIAVEAGVVTEPNSTGQL
jgi:ABC-type lipoprotein export system ATPase subunit